MKKILVFSKFENNIENAESKILTMRVIEGYSI